MINSSETKVADAISDSWVYRLLPNWLWPYAQLARWERPIGWWLLMWPCWWSLALAMSASGTTDFVLMIKYLALFMLGAVVMRGAGCTYNDLVDEKIDNKVARTRSRPLPSGRVSRSQAKIFMGLQLLIGLIVLLQFNFQTILLGFLSVVTIVIYPFMKRITYWPQLFLGFAFSWGAWVGWSSIFASVSLAPALLYIGCILWVIGYDTIYAHQDLEDDALVGVKSTARLFGDKTKMALVLLYTGALIFFTASMFVAGISWPAYAGLALGAGHLAWQIIRLRIKDAEQCQQLFHSNSQFGWIFFIGICLSMV